MKTYIAQLASGFELLLKANNLKEAKAAASRVARGNDKVLTVKWKKNEK